MKSLYIVDGHSHIFRAYHAVGYLSTSKGVPSHAVLILSTHAVEADPRGAAGLPRHRARPARPDVPRRACSPTTRPRARRCPTTSPASCPTCGGCSRRCARRSSRCPASRPTTCWPRWSSRRSQLPDLDVVVVSGDKDLLQLVGPRVRVLSVLGRTGERVMYDEAKVRERWGVEPAQIADVLALMGDCDRQHPRRQGRRREDRGEADQPVRLGRPPLREPARWSAASCARRWPPAASRRCSRASWPLLARSGAGRRSTSRRSAGSSRTGRSCAGSGWRWSSRGSSRSCRPRRSR